MKAVRSADEVWGSLYTDYGRKMQVATIRRIAATHRGPRIRKPTRTSFQRWQTHGTCSGLKADAYFAAARSAFTGLKIPADIGTGGDAAGVTPAQLLERFAKANAAYPAGSIALSCGNNRLTAIEVCLRKDLQPESCQGVRSCRANVIKVTPR